MVESRVVKYQTLFADELNKWYNLQQSNNYLHILSYFSFNSSYELTNECHARVKTSIHLNILIICKQNLKMQFIDVEWVIYYAPWNKEIITPALLFLVLTETKTNFSEFFIW